MTDKEHKVALITGGSRGIGRAIVTSLALAGWSIVFSYKENAEAASTLVIELGPNSKNVIPVQADIRMARDRKTLMTKSVEIFSHVDLLVNNAGIAPKQRVDLLEMTPDSYDDVMETNLKGPFFLTQMVARHMAAQVAKGASFSPKIININSISAYTTSTFRGEYCISKAGMAMMTALFADRLANEGILVYEIRPGIIETDMTAGVRKKYDDLISTGLLPIRRWGLPEDVARAVLTIAEGNLPYSTGEIINVDGGFHLRRL